MSLANLSGLIGVTNDAASPTALFPLGTTVIIGNLTYKYAQAVLAQAAAATTDLTAGFLTTAGTSHTHDVPAPGVPAGQYAFFKRIVSPL